MDPDVVSAIGSITSGGVAVIAAAIATLAWRTSVNASSATRALTEIERVRLHGERRPEFEVTLGWVTTDESILQVQARLTGPAPVLGLDGARLRLQPILLPMNEDGDLDYAIEPVEIYPYVFDGAKSRTDGSQLGTRLEEMQVGQSIFGYLVPSDSQRGRLIIERGLPKLRFSIECHSEGFDRWNIFALVDIPANPAELHRRYQEELDASKRAIEWEREVSLSRESPSRMYSDGVWRLRRPGQGAESES